MAPVRPSPRTPGRAAERRRRIQTGTPSPRTRGHGLTRLALGIIALTTLSSCDLLRSDSGIAEKLKRPSPAIPAYGDPVWSPDGLYVGFNHRPLKAIHFDSTNGYTYEFEDSLAGFWVISANGGTMKRVASFYMPRPTWTRDGAWIAFENEGQIWKASVLNDSIIGPETQVTSDPDGAQYPNWSPDGGRLLYTGSGGPTAELRIAAPDGTGVRHIGLPRWNSGDWHPDGSHIVFVGQVGPTYGIATCDTAGLGARALNLDGYVAVWSPDGSKIAYVSIAANPSTGPYDLWVADSSGAAPRRLSSEGVGGGKISWSPDGTRIVYLKMRPKDNSYTNGTLWIMRVDTGQEVQLTFTPG